MTAVPPPAGGFSGAAPDAARARPTYARGAIGLLKSAGPRGAHIIDLSAGTGLLAGQLVRAGLRVTATETSSGPARHLRRVLPGVPVVLAGGELPFPADVADVVTFAWSDGASDSAAGDRLDLGGALAEIARVLRPGGVVALVHDERDTSAPSLDVPVVTGSIATAPTTIDASGRFGVVHSESFAQPEAPRRTVVHLAVVAP